MAGENCGAGDDIDETDPPDIDERWVNSTPMDAGETLFGPMHERERDGGSEQN